MKFVVKTTSIRRAVEVMEIIYSDPLTPFVLVDGWKDVKEVVADFHEDDPTTYVCVVVFGKRKKRARMDI